MVKISYTSACLDSSGYAEAARNNIAALHKAGVEISIEPRTFEGQKANLGKIQKLISTLKKIPDTGKIQIIHLTPPNYSRHIRKDKYNIGYAAWETNLLPSGWVDSINQLDEIWVPSKHNVDVFKNSGVTIPIICIPHTFDIGKQTKSDSVLENRNEEDFVFYSIFQWLERKNPIALINAYLTEFNHDEKTLLVLKTFVQNPGNPNETNQIRNNILAIKESLHLRKYPKMLLVSSLLSKDQMVSLHDECDCYISLHHCEGFGIPITEAMLAGKPVITTKYGGPSDFIEHKKTGYLVDYQLSPVCGMPWEFYTGKMLWADPDIMEARKYMREIFEDRKKAKAMGSKGKKWIKDNFSWDTIGRKMKDRLEIIETLQQ